jgi:hypothetical protein
MGAVTVVIRARNPLGGVAKSVVADVTFSSSYAAGGDTFTPSQFGMNTILQIDTNSASASATTGYMVMPDLVNNKLKLMGSNGAAPAAFAETSTANQSATVARVVVIGDHPYI